MGNTECTARMKTDSEPKIREIHFNDPDKNKGFVTNGVHTTKYTPLSFIFLFLMNELSRPANVFFCLVIIIQVTKYLAVNRLLNSFFLAI